MGKTAQALHASAQRIEALAGDGQLVDPAAIKIEETRLRTLREQIELGLLEDGGV